MRRNRAAQLLVLMAVATAGLVHERDARADLGLSAQGSFTGDGASAYFGYAVAVDANTTVVGAMNDGGNGAAYVYVRSPGWTLQQKLTASDGAANDQFGYAVALSGNTLLVGAAGRTSGQGAVYAFTRTGSTWTQKQEITEGTGGQPNDCFGCALALSGATAVIGAPGASAATGGAFVYKQASTLTWSQQSQFLGGAVGDSFGFSVALNPSANVMAVGAFGSSSQRGSVYVFSQSGTTWTQPQAPLTASDGVAGDSFGYALGLEAGALLVGAYRAGGPGAAYVFGQTGAGWSQQQKLVPTDPTGSDDYGASVALNGTTALVGAFEHGGNAGSVYLYSRGSSGFALSDELNAPSSPESFAYAVAYSGTTVAIGAPSLSNNSGGATFYVLEGGSPVPAVGDRGASGLLLLLGIAGVAACRRRGGEAS
ncbi:MAG TPA: hypothetical protein VHV30_14610 [Polyangiaceae bacterium]|nr:hypothetical protein [Polyangiaceae bacterium]